MTGDDLLARLNDANIRAKDGCLTELEQAALAAAFGIVDLTDANPNPGEPCWAALSEEEYAQIAGGRYARVQVRIDVADEVIDPDAMPNQYSNASPSAESRQRPPRR